MLDGQFSNHQSNGVATVGVGAANNVKNISPEAAPGGPGISVNVAPNGVTSSSSLGAEHNAWVNHHYHQTEASTKQARKIQIHDNGLTTLDRVILCASEVIGTAILVFVGCASLLLFDKDGTPPPHLQVSFAFGWAIMVSVQIFGHISGSHINPMVTVAATIMGLIPVIHVPIYLVGQFLGAFAGFGLLRLATPEEVLKRDNYTCCSPILGYNVTPVQGLLVEFIISLLLVLVCCGIWDSRNKNKHDSVPIRFGFAITVLAIVGGPYTGGHMNPARSFAPALFNGNWANHWVYWVGPLSAGFIGAFLYRIVFDKNDNEE